MRRFILLLVFIPFFTSCEGLFEPAIENLRDIESIDNEAVLAQTVLGHAYLGNPLSGWSFNDVATDDAVSNDRTNEYMRIATGQWTANNSPMNGNWQNRRGSIQYINLFLDMLELNKVTFAKDPVINGMFRDRLKGDAYGMRALFMYHLILEHAGFSDDGQLLGIPVLLKPENLNSDFNLPRNTLKECIDQIYADVKVATDNLPLRYPVSTDARPFRDEDVPPRYKSQGVVASEYQRVFGAVNAAGRMDATIAEAIRAQATLLAASPAYSAGTGITWEQAANQMAIVLSRLGSNPISQIDATGGTWYDNSEVNTLAGGTNPKEILWRGDVGSSRNLEEDHFPPTLYGKGRLNPTQNLVDAFPMANGYPITNAASGYNPSNPYNGRDPRLEKYIIYNGSSYKNEVINTAEDGTSNNALNRTETSTRTGYYMKKLLRPAVNANPASANNAQHYKAFIRYTEIFLGYAEAANEAYGPQGTGTYGYSAYDVIKAIRSRAGITGGDPYLESIKTDKDKMREMIHNERRLELCFEGHRFWDLRRWKDSITETAKGMRISSGTYTSFDAEQRAYKDYMYYAPIPYSEILKYSSLKQNKGW